MEVVMDDEVQMAVMPLCGQTGRGGPFKRIVMETEWRGERQPHKGESERV